jgi:predicted amidohydrolase
MNAPERILSSHYQAAAVQFEPTQFEKERNILRLLELVHKSAMAGARLIVTPEMGITGYCWYDRQEVKPYVETVPGPCTDRFHTVARQFGAYIVIGLPEVDPNTDLYYNTAVLIGPDGIVGKHRKSHPYIAEPKWAASGDLGHAVFDTPIGRIALLVCMDIHFFETARLQALAGADIICHISNWLAERAPAPYWINRAFENSCYLIESNRWGLERTVQFSGGSSIVDPQGNVLSSIDIGDGVVYGAIDLEIARRREVLSEPVFEERRPSLYMNLMTQSFTWNPRDFFRLYGYQPPPPGRQSRVAVVQFAPADSVEENLGRIEAFTRDALEREKTDFIVFPELALSGLRDPSATAEELSGHAVSRLVALAMKFKVHLVVGLAEREAGALYNTAILVGPEGLAGSYRKIHLNSADKAWATAGADWKFFDVPIGRIGLLIGHDALFPEAVRCLAILGCDLVACPAAIAGRFTGAHPGTAIRHNYPIPTAADPYHWHALRVRAGESNVYLAFANVLDPHSGFEGKSGVFGPDTFAFPRQESAILEEEGFAVASIDTTNLDTPYPTNVVRRKDLLAMRLPHHYLKLVEP